MAEVAFNRGQLLTFLASVIGLWILLPSATAEQRDMLALDWATGIQAFAIALVGWGIISALRAPLIVIKEDRAKGAWHGTRYIYHEPYRIVTMQVPASARECSFPIAMPDAEANALVRFTVECQPTPNPRYFSSYMSYSSDSMFIDPNMTTGNSGAIRIPRTRTVFLHIRSPIAITVRVYTHWFDLGPGGD